jgi:hypothetical protein
MRNPTFEVEANTAKTGTRLDETEEANVLTTSSLQPSG